MNKLFVLIPLAATLSFGAKIGVLKNTGSCPNGQVVIDLDVEDSHNYLHIVSLMLTLLPEFRIVILC